MIEAQDVAEHGQIYERAVEEIVFLNVGFWCEFGGIDGVHVKGHELAVHEWDALVLETFGFLLLSDSAMLATRVLRLWTQEGISKGCVFSEVWGSLGVFLWVFCLWDACFCCCYIPARKCVIFPPLS